jgi:hypothetical protein
MTTSNDRLPFTRREIRKALAAHEHRAVFLAKRVAGRAPKDVSFDITEKQALETAQECERVVLTLINILGYEGLMQLMAKNNEEALSDETAESEET